MKAELLFYVQSNSSPWAPANVEPVQLIIDGAISQSTRRRKEVPAFSLRWNPLGMHAIDSRIRSLITTRPSGDRER